MSLTKNEEEQRFALQHWKLDGVRNRDFYPGYSGEDRAAKLNWTGRSLLSLSPYERLMSHRFVQRVRQKLGHDAMISKTRIDEEYDPVTRCEYHTPECGVWFQNAEDALTFAGLIETWPKRDIEFTLSRMPEPQELKLLKGLNHLIIKRVNSFEELEGCIVSTEYSPRVVEFRLRTAD
jgi:hypothetical protein